MVPSLMMVPNSTVRNFRIVQTLNKTYRIRQVLKQFPTPKRGFFYSLSELVADYTQGRKLADSTQRPMLTV